MKKFLSIILALAMVACMSVTAFAWEEQTLPNADVHGGTQTVTTSKAAPGYTLTIPADTSIPWGTTTAYCIGKFVVTADDDFDFNKNKIVVAVGKSVFTSSTPGVTTTIPYDLCIFEDMDLSTGLYFGFTRGGECPLYMQVKESAWEAADPGEYSTTITYSSEIRENF